MLRATGFGLQASGYTPSLAVTGSMLGVVKIHFASNLLREGIAGTQVPARRHNLPWWTADERCVVLLSVQGRVGCRNRTVYWLYDWCWWYG